MVDPWWIQHRASERARISTLNGHTHWQGVTGEAVNPEYLDRRFDSYEDEFLHQKPQQISSTFT